MKHGPPGNPRYSRWNHKNRTEENFSFPMVGKGVGYALILAVVLIIIASLVVYLTKLDESIVFWVVNIGSFVILGLASFSIARTTKRHGLLYGALIGGAYAILTSVIGAFAYPPFIGVWALLKRMGFSVLAGACGGVFGVNY